LRPLWKTRELIEWRSASHVRVVVVRPKYVRKGADAKKIVIAEPLALPIERGLAGPGLLAWVLVSKFCDHMPLHRLEGILDRYGAPIARSTLCGWIEAMHGLCAPLEQAMWQDALRSDYIAVEATGVLVQAKEQCRRSHFWVLASDNGHVLFRYTKRNNKGSVKELLGCRHRSRRAPLSPGSPGDHAPIPDQGLLPPAAPLDRRAKGGRRQLGDDEAPPACASPAGSHLQLGTT
jgi:transposase